MSTRYLILRANAPIDDTLELTNPSAWRRGLRGGGAQLSITIEDGHERDFGTLRADPQNAAVLDADVVFSLIKPKAKFNVDAKALDASLKQMGMLRFPQGLIAVGAHATNFSGQGVCVAVLDTGLDAAHPAFKGKQIAKRDFTGEGATQDDVTDLDGHGTHCVGTLCGIPVDGRQVGVAPGVTKLVVGKVLGHNGGSLQMFLDGMYWAVLHEKADVVSMSLGYDLPGNIERLVEKGVRPALAGQVALEQHRDISKGVSTLRAFLESQSKNVVFIAATGNESDRPNKFVLGAALPAAELFAVGAVGPIDATSGKWKVAGFSNGRAQVVAPGVDVVSAAVGGGWAAMSGTSMATPHVSGVAALLVEKLKGEGVLQIPDAVRSALRTSTTRRPLVDTDPDAIGAGLIQAPAN